MSDPAPLYWKRLLKIMADRNKNRLGDRAYQALLDALNGNAEARVLRKLAINTAETLGRHDSNRSPPQLGDKTLNETYISQSSRAASPPSAVESYGRLTSRDNLSRLVTRRRPAPPSP